jgi:hypothetical protein
MEVDADAVIRHLGVELTRLAVENAILKARCEAYETQAQQPAVVRTSENETGGAAG